jgi:hypothetical protein
MKDRGEATARAKRQKTFERACEKLTKDGSSLQTEMIGGWINAVSVVPHPSSGRD